MATDRERAEQLVARPAESLNVELKSWIDPSVPQGQLKILKAAMALRNRGGGFLVIGFDDKTSQADPNPPSDVRRVYKLDPIQQLVSRHSSEPFDVSIEFVERSGLTHPVIIVPAGVRVPVAIKKPLINASGGELLKLGEVPFRTLRANLTFSSADAGPNDWKDIMEICFDNREADIGRFVRRHLGGLDPETIRHIASALNLQPTAADSQSLEERARQLLFRGRARYENVKAWRGISAGSEEFALRWGTWEVAAVIDPPIHGRAADQEFYNLVIGSNPRLTEWPSWPDTRAFGDMYSRPDTREGAWESLVISVGSSTTLPWDFFNFMRLEPDGQFYQLRALDDDALARMRGARPGSSLDPGLMVQQVADAMAVALRFAAVLGCDTQTARIGLSFHWTGLKDRNLLAWQSRFTPPLQEQTASDDQATSFVVLPLDTSPSALAPYVEKAVKVLFAKFRGYAMPMAQVENMLRRLMDRSS
jgi:Schlafen, AlbA_2